MTEFRINVTSPVGPWGVTGDETGVTRLWMPSEPGPIARGVAPESVADAARQLTEYFTGARRHFSVRLAPTVATDFQRDVWDALCAIPYGETRTYADIATAVQRPRAVRAVGNANHANPWPIFVPCHRVVARSGIGGYGGGLDVKIFLLELEGAL